MVRGLRRAGVRLERRAASDGQRGRISQPQSGAVQVAAMRGGAEDRSDVHLAVHE
jgi:hypothetical protein